MDPKMAAAVIGLPFKKQECHVLPHPSDLALSPLRWENV